MHRFKTREGICILLAALVFAACLAVTVGNYAAYGEHNLDSDMSSEFVLAQLLNEEGRLITDSWYYSTEIRLVSPLPVYQLTLALFGSWHTARTVSIAILLVLMALSLLYLAKGVGCSVSSALLCASALILPVTRYHANLFVFGGCYTVWVTMTFLLVGLVLRTDRGRVREPVLILLLGFACGMGGVRMLMICAAPLLAACVLMFYLSLRGCDSLRAVAARPASRIAMGGVLAAAAIFAGYLVNAKVLAQHYHFKNYGVTSLLPLDMNQLGNHIVLLFRFLGYRLGSVLFSRDGIASMLAVALPIVGMIAVAILLGREPTARERTLALFIPIALAMGILINTLTIQENHLIPTIVCYYIPAVLLTIFAVFWALDRLSGGLKALCIPPMLVLVCAFLISNSVYRRTDVVTEPTEYEELVSLLREEGCTQGYATFWDSNVLTELSDGEIEVFCVSGWEELGIYEWLQRTDHVERRPQGRIFAICRAGDFESGVPGFDEEHLVYLSDWTAVFVYDSDEAYRAARES